MTGSRSVGRRLEAAVVLGASAALRHVPRGVRIGFGRGVGALLHRADRRHRELARRNIAAALGVGDAAAARIARETFLFFGRAFAEVLALPAYIGPRLEETVEIEGLEHLARAHALGRGVIAYSGHIGNWELAALRQSRAGFPLDYVVRPLDNPWLEERLSSWRRLGGGVTHGKHGAVRQALRTLREGRSLAFMIDQNMSFPPHIFVPFFGRPAATTPTLAHLALRTGAPVVPAWTVPRPGGRYVLRILPALHVPQSGDLEQRVYELTETATRLLEGWIRAEPASWLWLHDRWKTQPGPADDFATGGVP